VRYRPPDGTYLAWLDCTAMNLPRSPGEQVTDGAYVTVVDGPACGEGGAGCFRLNFATPHPVLTTMVELIAAGLDSSRTGRA
jgi:cysteine-S-conjugate beta-lyase